MPDYTQARRVTEADLPAILEWRNHPDIRNYMLTRHEISLAEHQQWFHKANADPSRCLLIIEANTQPIGYVQFTSVSEGGISDWGFYARPGAPKGSGRKLGLTALDYAFTNLGLHKVCGQALATNQASIRMHEALGFQPEGCLRDQHKIEDTYISLICFGLLRSEWDAARRGNAA